MAVNLENAKSLIHATLSDPDQGVVHFKWLARTLSLHVNHAKVILDQYAKECSPSGFKAFFCVNIENRDGSHVVKIMSESSISNLNVSEYQSVSSHIYALSSSEVSNINDLLYQASWATHMSDTPHLLKTVCPVQNSDIKHVAPTAKAYTTISQENPSSFFVSSKKLEDNPKSKRPAGPSKTASKAAVQEKAKLGGGKGNGQKKSSSVSSFLARNEGSKTGTCSSSITTTTVSDIKKVPVSDTPSLKPSDNKTASQDNNPEQASSRTREATTSTKNIMLYSNGSSNSSNEPMVVLKNQVKNTMVSKLSSEQSQKINSLFDNDDNTIESQAKIKISDGPSNEILADHEQETNSVRNRPSESAKRSAELESDAPLTRRVKKRRKVRRTETVRVGKDLRTRDVSDWEEYSEEETIHTHKPAPPRQLQEEKPEEKQTKSKKKSVPENQRSLLSFFKQK